MVRSRCTVYRYVCLHVHIIRLVAVPQVPGAFTVVAFPCPACALFVLDDGGLSFVFGYLVNVHGLTVPRNIC